MGEARAETSIARSADDVWARIGDFGDVSWFHGTGPCARNGDERRTEIPRASLVHIERLVRHDDATRTYTYETTGYEGNTVVSLPDGRTYDLVSMVRHHWGTITVVPEGESMSRVIYDVVLDNDDRLAEQMGANYQNVIEHLKTDLEG